MRAPIRFIRGLFKLFGRLSPPNDPLMGRVYREQQSLFINQSLTMGLVNIFNGLIACMLFMHETALWKIILWYSPVVLIAALQIKLWFRLHSRALPAKVSGRFLSRVEVTATLMGLVWGVAIFVLPTGENLPSMLVLVVIQCGMAAGVASLMTTLPRMVIRFSISCILLTVLGLVHHGHGEGFALIAPAFAYLTAVCAASLVSYRQLVASMRAQQTAETARADLTDAINSTRDAFAIIDEDNRIVLANERHRLWFGDTDSYTPGEEGEAKPLPGGRWVIENSRAMSRGGRVCVHTDITTLKDRERELIAARREAELADETKSRFLNAMSHELRTPLNVIIGFSRLMASDSQIELTQDQANDYAENIHASAEQLLRLINDIIDYSRIGLDGYAFRPDEFDLQELIESSIRSTVATTPGGEEVDFRISVPKSVETLFVDETAIRRILQNLISNAIKFGGTEKRVVIKAGVSQDGRPMVTVRDFGIGMHEEDVERAFEAFYQNSSTLSREFGGAGLGLTLTRHLARTHGGDVVLKSRLGAGTSATLILPPTCRVKPGNSAGNPELLRDAS